LERNGKRRRATANQLRPYYESRVESNIQFGQTRDELEHEAETDEQSPPSDARDAVEPANSAMENGDENEMQPPLNPQVIVREMTSPETSEDEEWPRMRTRQRDVKPRVSYEGRLRPRNSVVQREPVNPRGRKRNEVKKRKSPEASETTKTPLRKRAVDAEYESLADGSDLCSEEDELPPRR
jgi:hypothetical protein